MLSIILQTGLVYKERDVNCSLPAGKVVTLNSRGNYIGRMLMGRESRCVCPTFNLMVGPLSALRLDSNLSNLLDTAFRWWVEPEAKVSGSKSLLISVHLKKIFYIIYVQFTHRLN